MKLRCFVALVLCAACGFAGCAKESTDGGLCPFGYIRCGGVCIDPLTDDNHCGASSDCEGANAGVQCEPWEICNGEGVCEVSCQTGLINCGGLCVDPMTDPRYCGAMGDCEGANAGTQCEAGEICDGNGQCAFSCGDGYVECGGLCVDPLSDRTYCGATGDCQGGNAGQTCAAGEICDAGVCVLSCQSGLVDCNSTCINPLTDRAFCGVDASCQGGDVCEAGEICDAGVCVVSCQQGLIDCNGTCIDPDSNPLYCGAGAGCQGYTACGSGEACVGGQCQAVDICGIPFGSASYAAVTVFANAPLNNRPIGFAWDGTNLWTGNAGSASGDGLAQYDGSGNFIQHYQPGYSFRATFTKGDGTTPVYARAISSRDIMVMTSPGVFSNDLVLAGGAIDSQARVAWDADNQEFFVQNNGTVDRWDAAGNTLGTVVLQGYSTQNSEGDYPQNVVITWACGHYLTYSGGVVSAWSSAGVRVSTATLTGASTTFDGYFSFGYAQGKAWVVDDNNGDWRGYDFTQ